MMILQVTESLLLPIRLSSRYIQLQLKGRYTTKMAHYEVMINGKVYTTEEKNIKLARDIAIHDLKGKGTVDFVGDDYGDGNVRKRSLWIEDITNGRYTLYRIPTRSRDNDYKTLWVYDAKYNMVLGEVRKYQNKFLASWSEYYDDGLFFSYIVERFDTEEDAKNYVLKRIRNKKAVFD